MPEWAALPRQTATVLTTPVSVKPRVAAQPTAEVKMLLEMKAVEARFAHVPAT